MQYSYKIKNKQGQLLTGTLGANTTDDALKILRERDVFVITLQELTGKEFAIDSITSRFSRIGFSNVVDFTRQLATMLNAGLSLVESLMLLAKEASNPRFKAVIEDILNEIKSGGTLSRALMTHPNQFNKIYTSLIAAGEKSGKLDVILMRLADTLESQRAFKAQIKTAMIYPIIVVIGMLALTTMMMVVVIPQLSEVYDQFDVELPISTQMLIAMSNFMIHDWWVILIVGLAIFIWFPQFKKTELGIQSLDKLALNLPVWGSLKKDSVMTELTSTLSLLINAGVPILESLDIVSDALSSDQYSKGIKDAALKVERGFQLGTVLTSNPLYPTIFGQMVTVGEQTGKMDETLGRISLYFEASATEKVKRLTASLEPLILGVLGVGVGFLVFSIVMPMYQLTQAF